MKEGSFTNRKEREMRNRIVFGIIAAGLALLLTAEPAWAQRGGRGGGGGRGWSGGNWGGGGRWGGGWGGGWNRGFYGGRGFYGLGYGGLGYGWGGYGGGYYGGAYAPSYVYPGGGYVAGGQTYVANPTNTYQSFYSGPQLDPNIAQIRVTVPDSNAQVMFDGAPTTQRGTDRLFLTPALQPGKSHYMVTATWTQNGKTITREQRVEVQPGAQETVTFTANSPAGNQPNNRDMPPPNSDRDSTAPPK
jgi:uncharacterized protein (TIGR03000 family)